MNLLKPRALSPGQRVALVAPASPFKPEEFTDGVEEIRRLGFEPTWDDSVFEREDGHLFACCPQLKKPKDVQRLWAGLRHGEVSVISTDTCAAPSPGFPCPA